MREEVLDPSTAKDELGRVAGEATSFFDRAIEAVGNPKKVPEYWGDDRHRNRHRYWERLSAELRTEARGLAVRVVNLGGWIAGASRSAPLASEADQRDVGTATKAMRAALLLRRFDSWSTEVLHDEGRVLGVTPAGQSDDEPLEPTTAKRVFADAVHQLLDTLDLIDASGALGTPQLKVGSQAPARYRPGTAFIIMSMDPTRPELVDVADAVKEVFRAFDIAAVRADDIEHEGIITQRILDEIETAEFLFADVTGARPNVYYEVGYAHALQRRPILFRKEGEGLHFDLAGHNCPGYSNLRDLREKLTRRLEHATNRAPAARRAVPDAAEAGRRPVAPAARRGRETRDRG